MRGRDPTLLTVTTFCRGVRGAREGGDEWGRGGGRMRDGRDPASSLCQQRHDAGPSAPGNDSLPPRRATAPPRPPAPRVSIYPLVVNLPFRA